MHTVYMLMGTVTIMTMIIMMAAYPGGKGSEVLTLGGCCRGLAPSVTVLLPEAASAAEVEDEEAAAAAAATA